MHPIVALFIGLIIGWLIEWIIDWFYWRRRFAQQEQALASARAETTQAQAAEAEARQEATKMETRARAAEAALGGPVITEPPTVARRPDDLTKIKGIGPVIAKKLYAAGIMTYQQLARLSKDEFESIIGDLVQRFVDEDAIIEHARQLSEKK